MACITNLTTLTKIKKYDSLIINNDNLLEKDRRYLKNFRPIYNNIDEFITIIKQTFHRELSIIQFSKKNKIDIHHKILRIQYALNGIRNLLYYYNYFTPQGHKIQYVIDYLENLLFSVDTTEITKTHFNEFHISPEISLIETNNDSQNHNKNNYQKWTFAFKNKLEDGDELSQENSQNPDLNENEIEIDSDQSKSNEDFIHDENDTESSEDIDTNSSDEEKNINIDPPNNNTNHNNTYLYIYQAIKNNFLSFVYAIQQIFFQITYFF